MKIELLRLETSEKLAKYDKTIEQLKQKIKDTNYLLEINDDMLPKTRTYLKAKVEAWEETLYMLGGEYED